MINKKLSKTEEEELMIALDPQYSTYQYYKSKEWADVDGTGLMDREQFLDLYWYHWGDYGDFDEREERLEWDWDKENEHNHSISISEFFK